MTIGRRTVVIPVGRDEDGRCCKTSRSKQRKEFQEFLENLAVFKLLLLPCLQEEALPTADPSLFQCT
jgi:hypothetical protein